MTSVQLIVIVLYFALTVVVGLLAARRSKTASDFHGAEMGLFAIVCASTGEWLGGTATSGVAEYGFLYGLSGAPFISLARVQKGGRKHWEGHFPEAGSFIRRFLCQFAGKV